MKVAPLKVGDRVRLGADAAFHVGQIGTVTRADVPIARAYEIGWDSFGVIEVQIDPNTRWSGHYSHVELIETGHEV